MIDDTLREELSALFDGALPEKRAQELRRMIREDKELSREYAELERAALAVRALPRRGAPPELRARLDAALRPRRGRILRFGAIAAAAVVLLAVGLAVHFGRGTTTQHFEAKDEEPAPARELEKKAADADARVSGPAAPAEARAPAPPGNETSEVNVLKAERDEAAKEEGGKLDKSRGAKRQQEPDLLATVARTRKVPAAERKLYLRQLAALDPEKARQHLRAVVGDEVDTRLSDEARSAEVEVLATIRLEDREEANLVQKVLGTPATAHQAAALAVEKSKDDAVTAEVTGTAAELSRLGRWLELLDLSRTAPVRPRVTFFGEPKGGAEAAEEVRTAIVKIAIGKPPEPQPEAPPPKKDK